jgi:hypothetical protein
VSLLELFEGKLNLTDILNTELPLVYELIEAKEKLLKEKEKLKEEYEKENNKEVRGSNIAGNRRMERR